MESTISCNNSVTKRKNSQYTNESLKNAIADVKYGLLTSRAAATKHNVPRSTIIARLKKPDVIKRGPKQVISSEDEKEIAQWIIQCQKLGQPRTRKDITLAAGRIAKVNSTSSRSQFKNSAPSSYWIYGFLKRNPEITFRKPEGVSRASATVSKFQIAKYFQNIQDFLRDQGLLNLLNEPSHWINLDEKSYSLNAGPLYVAAKKGSKSVYQIESGNPKENLTVTHGFVADGTVLPSQIIFKSQFSNMAEVANESIG